MSNESLFSGNSAFTLFKARKLKDYPADDIQKAAGDIATLQALHHRLLESKDEWLNIKIPLQTYKKELDNQISHYSLIKQNDPFDPEVDECLRFSREELKSVNGMIQMMDEHLKIHNQKIAEIESILNYDTTRSLATTPKP